MAVLRNRHIAGALALVLLAGLAEADASGKPIVIAGSLSLSGSYEALGQTQHRGLQLCIKHNNANGGALGRPLKLVVEDDRSDGAIAVRIYRKLVLEHKVDAVFAPYSSTITEAVAEFTEKYRLPLIAAGAASSSIFKKRRKYVFMILTPTDVYFEGLMDLAAKRGLKTVALLYQDANFTRAAAQGGRALARQKGLEVIFAESYPRDTVDFSNFLSEIKTRRPDVLAAATYFKDVVAITEQMKKLDVNPKMFGATVGVHIPKFYATLGKDAEYVYGATQWELQLATMRAGGIIPIGREYPGTRQFVADYKKEYPSAPFSHLTAAAYAGCQILLKAIRQAGTFDGDKVREAILSMNTNTVYGAFRVDQRGLQVAHKLMWFQWQDGKKVIVWPRELTSRMPRFPTPSWGQR